MRIKQYQSIHILAIIPFALAANVSCSQPKRDILPASHPPEVVNHSEGIVKSVEVHQYPEIPEEAEVYSYSDSHPHSITITLEGGGTYVHVFDENGKPRSVYFYEFDDETIISTRAIFDE